MTGHPAATTGALPWWGSKHPRRPDRLGQWIAKLLPQGRIYVEPFAGMLGVLLVRRPSKIEVVNDLDGRVVNWWTVVRDRPGELIDALMSTPVARQHFDDCIRTQHDDHADDIERARRLTVAMWQAVIPGQPGWSANPTLVLSHGKLIPTHARLADKIAACADRIRGVQIDHRDALEVIAVYADCPDVVMYCDPPYPDSHADKYAAAVDHDAMIGLLAGAEAKVALSGDPDDDDGRLSAAGWTVQHRRRIAAETTNQRGDRRGDAPEGRTEALWTNYPPHDERTLF